MTSIQSLQLDKAIVLIGLMGCGKSSIGRRLADEIGIKFFDLDLEIEKAEGLTVTEIFKKHGEEYFRQKEEEIVQDIVSHELCVLATGGGAFINDKIRTLIKAKTTSVWIKVGFDILLERVSRKNTRPLLEKGDKAEILKNLMDKRYPIYEKADIIVDSAEDDHMIVVKKIMKEL